MSKTKYEDTKCVIRGRISKNKKDRQCILVKRKKGKTTKMTVQTLQKTKYKATRTSVKVKVKSGYQG